MNYDFPDLNDGVNLFFLRELSCLNVQQRAVTVEILKYLHSKHCPVDAPVLC